MPNHARTRATALLAALTIAACSGDDETAPRESARFVGRPSCTRCHEAENETWKGSHHDLAMQEASTATVLGDFDGATFEYAGVTSTFSTQDGRFIARTDGPDGELRDYEIRYAFGVTPLQQYIVATERGRLQCLEIAWDSRPANEGGQRWFHLYPGEAVDHRDPLHWTGRAMNWNFMCASCHSTDLRRNYDVETDSYDTTWSEIDVSCEACHGPGSRHVAWADGGRPAKDPSMGLVVDLGGIGEWYFEPGATIAKRRTPLESHVEVETCAPCHSRRSQASEAPWHGDPYLDHYHPSLLEPGLYHADGQILDEVYVWGSFVQSRMYAAGVTCSDCHDAHSLELRWTGNTLCSRCHLAAEYDVPEHHHHDPGTAGASCIECHMVSRTYMVVDPRRDHSFRVPRPDLTVRIGTPNACQECHAEEGAQWAADAVAAWIGDGAPPRPGFAPALHDARLGKPRARSALERLAADVEQPPMARATALSMLDTVPARSSVAALRAAFADPDPLARFGAAQALHGLEPDDRVALGVSLLSDPVRSIRAESARALASLPDSSLDRDARAARDSALEDWLAFQRTNVDQPWAHVNLGVLHLERGEIVEAEKAYRRALRIEPRSIQARVNLADLMRERERDDLGEALLREGIDRDPDLAELRHALGLLLVRRGRATEALGELEAAARSRPENPRFAYVFAVGLESAGERDRAIAELEEALARHPWDPELLLGLTTWLRDRGDAARALEFARRLAEVEPQARALVDELRGSGR